MSPENELQLSFYKNLDSINNKPNICLVRHIESGKIFVRKTLSTYAADIYKTLQSNRFPHIPDVVLLIEDDEALIIIEEYINGTTLDKLMEHRTFTEDETIALIDQLCYILAPLHSSFPPIIHRDIKPSNLMLDNNGNLYLIDFDAAKHFDVNKSRDTVLMGTTDFAAPEQFGFLQSDARTDIYAIGVLMNKMLTGLLPSEHLYSQGFLPSVISKCTAIDPANRYSSVMDLACVIGRGSWCFNPAGFNPTDFSPSKTCNIPESKPSVRFPKAPPGFRGGNWHSMILATLWYIFLIYLLLTTGFDDHGVTITGTRLWVNRIFFFMSLLLPTLYGGNFLGIADKIPNANVTKKSTRNIIRCLICIALFILCAIMLTVTEVILQT